jgi:hypothetical protein
MKDFLNSAKFLDEEKKFLNRFLEMNKFQREALKQNVPDPLFIEFNNEFQVASLMIGIPHDQAVQLTSVNRIFDYMLDHSDQMDIMIRRIEIRLTVTAMRPNLDPDNIFQPVLDGLLRAARTIMSYSEQLAAASYESNSTESDEGSQIFFNPKDLEHHGFSFLMGKHHDHGDNNI